MPKLGLGLSLLQTRVASAPLIPTSGLSLWLKADAGVTLATFGPYTYASQIVISGSNTPNVNGTYTATSVPTFDESGNPNSYSLVGPNYNILWGEVLGGYPVSFSIEIGLNCFLQSNDRTNWNIAYSQPDTITVSGSNDPQVNGTYICDDFANFNYWYNSTSTYVITRFGFSWYLSDQFGGPNQYSSSSPNGPWTIEGGSGGAITSTTTLVPRGSITATKVVSSVVIPSSNVIAWADQSSYNRNAALNNGTPLLTTIGGNAFVEFAPGSEMYTAPIWGEIEIIGTILIVAHFPQNSSFSVSHRDNTYLDQFSLDAAGANPFVVQKYPTVYASSNLNPAYNTKCIIETTFNSSTVSLYLNGIACGSGSRESIIGADDSFFLYGNQSNVAEIVVYNRVLSTPERQQVEAYLIDKYAIDITTSRAFDSSGNLVGSAITGNIPSDWVPSSNVASVIFANNGSLTLIGSRALRNNPLTSVTIPNSVTGIGSNAFDGCASLANAIIGNNVTTVSNSAFANCTGLISINVPNSVIIMGSSVFYGCTSLTSATLPTNINFTSINTFTFYGCTSLTSITIPNGVTNINANAFYGCTSLPSITIPNLVTSIGANAFYGCTSLTSLTIPNSVTSIGASAFRNSTNLASVNCYTTYGAFVGNFAFLNTASALTIHVRVADNTWTIGSQSFQGNPNVTVINDL